MVRQAAELAASLATQLPREGRVEYEQTTPLATAGRFLGAACYALDLAQPERRLTVQQRRSLAGDVLRAVPGCYLTLTGAFRRAAGGSLQGVPERLHLPGDPDVAQAAAEVDLRDGALTCEQLALGLHLLGSLSIGTAGPNSPQAPHPITANLADVAAWAAAASSAACALPWAAELRLLLAASPVERTRSVLAQMPAQLASAVVLLSLNTSVRSSGFVYQLQYTCLAALPPAEELAAALSALWQLHSTACRWVHWAAANPAAAAALWQPSGPSAVRLLGLLRHSFVAAHETWAALRRRLPREQAQGARCGDEHDRCAQLARGLLRPPACPPDRCCCLRLPVRPALSLLPPVPCRHMMAIQAAHFEALLAAAAHGAPALWDFDARQASAGDAGYAADAFEFSVQRVAGARNLLLWSPALQAACVFFAQHLPQVRVPPLACLPRRRCTTLQAALQAAPEHPLDPAAPACSSCRSARAATAS